MTLEADDYVFGKLVYVLLELHARLIPAHQEQTGSWSAFVAQDLAPVFADTPWHWPFGSMRLQRSCSIQTVIGRSKATDRWHGSFTLACLCGSAQWRQDTHSLRRKMTRKRALQ